MIEEREALEAVECYERPPHGWTCFHCGETFTTPGAARDHFGFDPSADPACRIKLGAERGLVRELRKAEADNEELLRLLHDETSEAYRLYARQSTRHRAQLMAAEEAGYEKAVADCRQAHESEIARLTTERDNAYARLFALGGAPDMAPDLPALAERLTAMYSHRGDGIPTQHVNPDGPDAWAAIEALNAKLAKVRAALEWYAEQVTGCRKLGSIGYPFRCALDADGGKRAIRALKDTDNG